MIPSLTPLSLERAGRVLLPVHGLWNQMLKIGVRLVWNGWQIHPIEGPPESDMMKLIGKSLFLIVVFLTGTCSRSDVSGNASTYDGGNVTVIGHTDGAPAGCNVEEVGQRILDFANAFNRQDSQLAPMFFGAGVWYSGSEGDNAGGTQYTTIYLGRDLAAFFERRHAQHEQLTFKKIQINGWESQRNIVHFGFTVNRQADDLYDGEARDVMGKGAFHCQTQKIIVFALE